MTTAPPTATYLMARYRQAVGESEQLETRTDDALAWLVEAEAVHARLPLACPPDLREIAAMTIEVIRDEYEELCARNRGLDALLFEVRAAADSIGLELDEDQEDDDV